LTWEIEKGECHMLKKADAGTESPAEKTLYQIVKEGAQKML
jgi:hypothetical protein